MKLFADTADLRELKELDEMGLICGIPRQGKIWWMF